jgi:hypothetical protein
VVTVSECASHAAVLAAMGPAAGGKGGGELLRDIQDEHGGVTQHEHPEAGIPGTRECGDVHGVAGMLTLAALRAVGAAGCSW